MPKTCELSLWTQLLSTTYNRQSLRVFSLPWSLQALNVRFHPNLGLPYLFLDVFVHSFVELCIVHIEKQTLYTALLWRIAEIVSVEKFLCFLVLFKLIWHKILTQLAKKYRSTRLLSTNFETSRNCCELSSNVLTATFV